MYIDQNEVVTNAVAKVVEDAAIGLWNKVKKYFKDFDIRNEVDLGISFEKYIEKTKVKNSKIKTLIYRHVPKDLYSFYECVGIQYENKIIDTKNVNNVLELGNKIIISGTGGIGKSTMLKHFFLNCIQEADYVPVLIELRGLNSLDEKEISLFDVVYDNMINNGFELEKEYFEYSMNQGAYLILLDGYDEVKRDNILKISNEIKELSNKYSENKYIITSRPSEDFIGWNDFVEAESMKLNKQQALNLIKKLDFEKNVKENFYKELDDSLFEKYESFASNPLLLTIMLLTYDNRASIPDKLNDFYEQAFSTLFNMHDATKDAFVRDIRSGLGCEDFKLIFAYMCFKSYFASEFEFTEIKLREYISDGRKRFKIKFHIDDYEEDLVKSVCMMIKEGLVYRFSHRSFQEYFAAWYTCKLPDSVQHKLLTSWLKEKTSVLSDSYFSMLFDLQREKVNSIIFCPGIKELKNLYEKKKFSVELLTDLFAKMAINDIGGKKVLSFLIKDHYLCEIMQMTCNFNCFKAGFMHRKTEEKIIDKLLKNGKAIMDPFDISDVLEIVTREEFLEGVAWVEKRIQFCIGILDEYGDNKIRNKRKVASILEQL